MEWNYRQPVRICFGSGRLRELPQLLGEIRRPLLVTDRFFAGSSLADEILAKIGGSIFSDVSPNPDVTEVNRCSEQLRAEQCDGIIALGGGSVIDLAKAAALAVPDITKYHGTGLALPETALPLIAIPTTAGTGSEVTNVSVLTNRAAGTKIPISSDVMYPKLALIDPALTVTAPPAVTASCGVDVLCHAVEGYWSLGHQPICDALAVHAVKTVFAALPRTFAAPDDLPAREQMAEASLIAGLAFALPKTTAAHACSYPLTSLYGIPHGEACGLTLDFFARLNATDSRTQQLARETGFSDAAALADAIFRLKQQLGLRTSLSDLNLDKTAISELVQKSRHPNLLNNPVPVTDEDLSELYYSLTA